MKMNKKTCIEVGTSAWFFRHFDRKGNLIASPNKIMVPEDLLWNAQSLAQHIKDNKGQITGRLLFLLDISQTFVRIDADFPFDEKSGKYVFSQEAIGDVVWKTALPSEVSGALVEMVALLGVKPSRIHTIDTLEYRMARYLSGIHSVSFWLLLPQGAKIRLVIMQEGLFVGCYFFSNAPDFRVKEVSRFLLSYPPKLAILMSDDPDHLWLHEFLARNSVEVVAECEDFKENMIADWISTG